MKLIYIDEAGQTGTKLDPNQPIHLLSAIVVDVESVRKIEDAVRSLGQKYFGALSERTDFEFHGYEIQKGKGHFRSKNVEERIRIVSDLIDILLLNDVKVGFVAINKLKSRASLHPHQLAFLFLVERIEDLLVNEDTMGLLIADENHEMEQRLIEDLELFKTKNTKFGWRPTQINRIVDSVHFVRSKNNRLIQLSDIVAYVLLRGRRVQDLLFLRYLKSINENEPISYFDWLKSNASKGQMVDIELLNKINKMQVFSKTFPQ
ncbi:MAG: DUF3800 domain-containing protein [Pseudomonadota bacterium]|nr:DUF3800 domain-containing protein [Pseudomonadota bacterium]